MVSRKCVQKLFEIRLNEQQLPERRRHETGGHGVVEKGDQAGEVVRDIKQRAWFGVDAELRPGDDLAQLIECAEAARQRDEAVGQLSQAEARSKASSASAVIAMTANAPSLSLSQPHTNVPVAPPAKMTVMTAPTPAWRVANCQCRRISHWL